MRAYTSDIIKSAVKHGLMPDVKNGGNTVRMYICPYCKGVSRMKFRGHGKVIDACKCGYRKSG